MKLPSLKKLFNGDAMEAVGGENLPVQFEHDDVMSTARGQVKYIAYSKKARILYADGKWKPIFGIHRNKQNPNEIIIRHRRAKKTSEKASIPKTALISLANPNRFVCLTHGSDGHALQLNESPLISLVNQNEQQDKEIERLRDYNEVLESENMKLRRSRGEIFDEEIEKTKKAVDSIAEALRKSNPKQKPRDDYNG